MILSMNHHLAKTYRRRQASVIVVIAILALFFLLQKGLLKRLNPFFSHIVTPIWQAENFTREFLALNLDSKRDLYRQNILLKKELESRSSEIAASSILKAENESLKVIMGRIPEDRNVVLSAILAKPNTTPYDTLIIDRGSKDGIKVDDLVFVGGDVLIGEIESVEENISRVIMFSTPGNISQVLYGNTGKYFNARGNGNGAFEVDVSREIEVVEGDMFFYPGLDHTLVGIAKRIDFDSRDSFKTVIMKSPINIQEERWVQVRI